MAKSSYYPAVRAEVVRLLKEERCERGFSKYAISHRSGVSESMISLVERGLRNPSLETLLRIADGIECDLATIIAKATKRVSKRSR